MGRSLSGSLDEQESTPHRGSFHDVESLLHKPLLGDSKPGRTQSAATYPTQSKTIHTPKFLRCHSAPSSVSLSTEDSRPPSDGTHSILFKAILAVIVYFVFGIFSFYVADIDLFGTKTQSFIDALYFSVVTLTTVGYGDLVPGTAAGKLFTCAYVFVGFSLVGALVSGAANYIVERQEQIIVNVTRKKARKTGNEEYEQFAEDDLTAAFWKALVSGVLVICLLIMGIAFLIRYEGLDFIDAFYCVCVTVTSLGYGDNSFKTAAGRLFGAIWILSSTVCVAQFFLYIAEMRTGHRQLELAHWALHRRTTGSDLEAADLDGDRVVSAPEFVIFKLKELGKIDEEDVVGILREFRALDYDRSGTISISDLSLAQPS